MAESRPHPHTLDPQVAPTTPPVPHDTSSGVPPVRRRRRGRTPGTEADTRPIADRYPAPETPERPVSTPIPVRTVDEARALARERFRDRVSAGEQVGGCDCHSTDADAAAAKVSSGGPAARVAGVRFRDSGRMYYFDAGATTLEPGDWVVVDTERGHEAGRVIIAPHQLLLSQLQGELRPVLRRLSEDDVATMDRLRRESSSAVRTFSDRIRQHKTPIKPISATYSFDGSLLTLSYAPHQGVDRPDLRALGGDLAQTFGCRIDLVAVSQREEARLLGGLGRCGRTLCCSSWLPVFPEINMGMAKTQDLALNPTKVSGVCGRLLCCLSYENEQYKQLKAVLPRLGQRVETTQGWGQVISLQVIREQVTVRLEESGEQVTMPGSDIVLHPNQSTPRSGPATPPGPTTAPGHPAPPTARTTPPPADAPVGPDAAQIELARAVTAPVPEDEDGPGDDDARRRRRRRRARGAGDASA